MLLFKRLDHCIARVAGRSVILFVLLGISACANLNTAYRARTHSAKSVSTISIDAKQRNIFFVPEWEKQNGNQMRMCAEASPDVFSALAASGGALVNVDAKAQAGSGQVGFSIAETAASIERTQTVNLLRESFYRTCERYLSGAIGKEAFSVQAGRDARAMVAVLAIEQLTGAIRRPSTIISGPATAVQLQTANNALALLGPAQERARDADAAVIKKLAEISSCSTKKGTDDKPLTKEQVDACVATGNAELKDLKAQRDRADAEVKQIVAVSGNVVPDKVMASTGGGQNQTGDPADKPDYVAIEKVAEKVRLIVEQVTQQDDMRLFCIEEVNRTGPERQNVRDVCIGLLAAAVNQEESQLREILKKNLEKNRKQAADREEARTRLMEFVKSSTNPQYEFLTKGILSFCAQKTRVQCAEMIPTTLSIPDQKIQEALDLAQKAG